MRRVVAGVLVAISGISAHADGIAKVGTYALAQEVQAIGGRDVHFWGAPSMVIGMSFETPRPAELHWRKPSRGIEAFHVKYDIDDEASGTTDGELSNTALLYNLSWSTRIRGSLRPYWGLGGGLNFVDFSMTQQSSYFYEDEITLAAQGFAGLEWRARDDRLGIVGEVKLFDSFSDVDVSGAAAFLGFSMPLD